jgi:hypothetical protein
VRLQSLDLRALAGTINSREAHYPYTVRSHDELATALLCALRYIL